MTEKKYRWIASSNDGAFQDESEQEFNSKEDCYNDMRNAALEKMKWNTEFKHDYFDCASISYEVIFSQGKIIHESYSGVYTYEIKEVPTKLTIQLSVEEIKTICHALASTISNNDKSVKNMYDVCGDNIQTREIASNLLAGNMKMRDLIEYLQQQQIME